MHESRATEPGVRREMTSKPVRPELPSWLMSLVLHLVILLVLGMTLRLEPRQGATAERTAEVGIALKHQEGDREYYQTGAEKGGDGATSDDGVQNRASLDELLSNEPPVDPSASLPSAMNVIGPVVLGEGGMPHASGLSEGSAGRKGPIGGKARPTLFGVTGEGWKFVYVFDRSDSMNWHDRKPLKAAKAELLGSLDSLDAVHQFQIIFYNQEPEIFNPSGQRNKLAFATDQNKRNARRFVGGITASGGTQHESALKLAIKLQPDVIFFLTDADDPQLSAGQLYDIHRLANGITIHAIEFGVGPKGVPNNFLARLARQNGGQYAYVDVSKL